MRAPTPALGSMSCRTSSPIAVLVLLIGCSGIPGDLDPSGDFVLDDGGVSPSSWGDAGTVLTDAGRDAGAHGGHPDASVKGADSGSPDASVKGSDAGSADASVKSPDAGAGRDASVPDAGRVEIPEGHSPGDARDPLHKHGGNACADCHGSTLQGGSGRSCYKCHTSVDHTVVFEGVKHRDGGQSSCPDCHGPNNDGGLGPACSTCHQ